LTNISLNSLKAKLETLENKIATERRELGEEQAKLQKSHEGLSKELSELKGGIVHANYAFTAVSLLFAALSIGLAVLIGITGSNLIQYQKFETVRRDAYDILVDVFQHQLADAIDQLTLVSPPTEQERLANDISRTQKRLMNLGADSDGFKRRSDLADGLDLILRQRIDEALKKLDEIIKYSVDDSFVQSRALALKVYTIILKDKRECESSEIPQLLKRALEKDSQVAIVYNAMGICTQHKASEMSAKAPLSVEGWKTYADYMQKSIDYYKIASEIKPTVQSKYRAINNVVWANCNMFEATLKHGFPTEIFTDVTGYSANNAFLTDSLKQLLLAETLDPKSLLAPETRAELLCLGAYSEKDDKRAEEKWSSAKTLYLRLIEQGLYTGYSCKEAVVTLRNDTLLGKLVDDEDILKAIRGTYPVWACP
jgi:hypothetical protein